MVFLKQLCYSGLSQTSPIFFSKSLTQIISKRLSNSSENVYTVLAQISLKLVPGFDSNVSETFTQLWLRHPEDLPNIPTTYQHLYDLPGSGCNIPTTYSTPP